VVARTNVGFTGMERARPVATVEKVLDGLGQINGPGFVERAGMSTCGFRSAESFNRSETGFRHAPLVRSIFFEGLALD